MRSTGITVFTTRKSMKVFSRASTFYRKARTYCPCVKYGIFVMFKNLMKMIKYKYFCQEVLLLDWVFFLSFRSEITFSFFDVRLCMGGRLSTFSFFDGKALSGRVFVHLVIFWWEGSLGGLLSTLSFLIRKHCPGGFLSTLSFFIRRLFFWRAFVHIVNFDGKAISGRVFVRIQHRLVIQLWGDCKTRQVPHF